MNIGKAAGTQTASQEAPEDLMSVREAAQVLGVSMATSSLWDPTGARDWGQDQSGTADSTGQVQFTLTAPSVVTTTEIYTAQVTHTRADGGVTTLTAKQRFRVIPTLP